MASSAPAARILDVSVESKPELRQQLIHVEVLFDPVEAAVELELLAFEFNGHHVPPLRPIISNNPSARSADGQFVVKAVAAQKDQRRVLKHSIVVSLDELKLAKGLHQLAYQVRALQDGKTVEVVSAPMVYLSVIQPSQVIGRRTESAVITDIRTEQREIEVPREIDGQTVMEKKPVSVRVPVSREVRQEIPEFERGEYADVFAAVTPRAAWIDDPNIAAQVEEIQTVPWTPPRTIDINFATNRNIVRPQASDSSRFGNEVGELTYGSARINISVKKTHGERSPAQEPVRPTPQDSFTVSEVTTLSEDAFYQTISNALWQTAAGGSNSKNDVVLFIHGYNNSFRFSCVRFAQLVYDTRFEGTPVLFSWPSNGGDSLMDGIAGFLGYGSDRADAEKSVAALVQVLRELAEDRRRPAGTSSTRGDIHLVAHSMGCQLLVDALNHLHSEWASNDDQPFKSIILAAPDVDANDLTEVLQCVRTPAERVTLYFCEADRALWASSQFHAQQSGSEIRRRAGQALCVLPEIENIDANKANTTFIGHSYFVDGSLVLRDIEDIVLRDYSPEMRVLCPDNKLPEEYAYWKIIDDKTNCLSPATPVIEPSSP